MCKSIPGSSPPFLFFVGARGEPGNEANCTNNVDNRLSMRNNKILLLSWLSELKVSRELTVIKTFVAMYPTTSHHLFTAANCQLTVIQHLFHRITLRMLRKQQIITHQTIIIEKLEVRKPDNFMDTYSVMYQAPLSSDEVQIHCRLYL